jgi:hypothetical protein
MTKSKYAIFDALNPFFEIVQEGLTGLVDGKHFFDTIADDAFFDFRGAYSSIKARTSFRLRHGRFFSLSASRPHKLPTLCYSLQDGVGLTLAIEELFQHHPDHYLFGSLPGAGSKLTPRFEACNLRNKPKSCLMTLILDCFSRCVHC